MNDSMECQSSDLSKLFSGEGLEGHNPDSEMTFSWPSIYKIELELLLLYCNKFQDVHDIFSSEFVKAQVSERYSMMDSGQIVFLYVDKACV